MILYVVEIACPVAVAAQITRGRHAMNVLEDPFRTLDRVVAAARLGPQGE